MSVFKKYFKTCTKIYFKYTYIRQELNCMHTVQKKKKKKLPSSGKSPKKFHLNLLMTHSKAANKSLNSN